MVRLASRMNCPVNGFMVTVAETGWHQQFWDFRSAGDSLWAHLKANDGLVGRFPHLPKSRAACDAFVDLQNAMRMQKIRGADSYIVEDQSPNPNLSAPQRRSGVVGRVSNAVSGARVLESWFGSGGRPVAADLAQRRADVCLQCPLNKLGDFWQRTEASVASGLRSLLEFKGDLNLKTHGEESLHSCQACDCWMPLKIWVPLSHIAANTTPETRASLDPSCWVLSETQ